MERKIRRMKLKLLTVIIIGFILMTFSPLIVVVLLERVLPELFMLPSWALIVVIAAVSFPFMVLGIKMLQAARGLASDYRGLKKFKEIAFTSEDFIERMRRKKPRVYIWDDVPLWLNSWSAHALRFRYAVVFAEITRVKRINLLGLIVCVGTIVGCFGWFIWLSVSIGLDFAATLIMAFALLVNSYLIRRHIYHLRGIKETERMAKAAYEKDLRR